MSFTLQTGEHILLTFIRYHETGLNASVQLPHHPESCHSSGGQGSSPGQVMWDLWCKEWHWRRFSLTNSASFANPHSTHRSALIFIYHQGLVHQADVTGGLSLISPEETKTKNYISPTPHLKTS
jgi:hypothetical protein